MTNDPLLLIGYVALPKHEGKGAFDHAAVHAASGHVYVATRERRGRCLRPGIQEALFSVPRLPGVAGSWSAMKHNHHYVEPGGEHDRVFAPGPDPQVLKIAVGVHPNGLA